MTGHIYVVASGFGCRVVPLDAPFEFSLGDDEELALQVGEGTDARRCRVDRGLMLDEVTGACRGIAEVRRGPDWPEWWLETTPFRVPLPRGWTAVASGGIDPAPFVLFDAWDRTAWMQSAARPVTHDTLVAPGQRVVARGISARGTWLDLEYEHDGSAWEQRHVVVPLTTGDCVLTGQTLAGQLDPVRALLDLLAREVKSPDSSK